MLNILANLPKTARIILNTGRQVPTDKALRKLEEREVTAEVLRAINTWEYTRDDNDDSGQ